MKENHYSQGALLGGPEHFNRAQNFQESFQTLVTTCLCIKTLVLILQSLTKAGILRDFSFHHTGIFSLLQLADQLWHWKWNPCSSGRKWSLNKWHEKQAPNSQTRTYRADKSSLERHSRQNKLSWEGLRPSRGWSRRWVWGPVNERHEDRSPMRFSESKLGSSHWSRREVLRRWGGRRAEDKAQHEGH